MVEITTLTDSFQALQIIGLVISLFLIGKTITDYRKDKMGKGTFLFWIILWGSAFTAFIIPQAPRFVFGLLEKGDVFIIALIFTNVILFLLVYVLFNKTYSLNKQIRSLVQKLALKEEISTDEQND